MTPIDPTPAAPADILRRLISSCSDPRIQSCLRRALEQLRESFSTEADTPPPLPPLNNKQQVEALIALTGAALPTSVLREINEALHRAAVGCFSALSGLERVRCLGELWRSHPDDMQFYGLFRAACLDGTLSDVTSIYPTLDIPLEDLAAWIVLGRALIAGEQLDEALQVLGLLVRGCPDNPVIGELYANALVDAGHEATADAHYCRIAERFVWPAGLVRFADDWFSALPVDDDSARSAAMAPADPNLLVFAISADDGYICRYLMRLASSLAGLYGSQGWLLHVHMINPGPGAEEIIDMLSAAGVPIACSTERIVLPPSETSTTGRIIEARTYYACARLRLLPELLDTYRVPVWLIDTDMVAESDLRPALAEAKGITDADVAFVFLERKGRCLTEKIFLSLSCYRPTPLGRRYARTVRAYLDAMLASERWGWGLDQAAVFCSLRWLQRAEPRFKVASLPDDWVVDGDASSEHACFRSLVGSVNYGRT